MRELYPFFSCRAYGPVCRRRRSLYLLKFRYLLMKLCDGSRFMPAEITLHKLIRLVTVETWEQRRACRLGRQSSRAACLNGLRNTKQSRGLPYAVRPPRPAADACSTSGRRAAQPRTITPMLDRSQDGNPHGERPVPRSRPYRSSCGARRQHAVAGRCQADRSSPYRYSCLARI